MALSHLLAATGSSDADDGHQPGGRTGSASSRSCCTGTGAVNALATTRLSELPGVRAAAAEDANAMAG